VEAASQRPGESKARELARFLHIQLPRDLGRELEVLGARNVRLVFVLPGVKRE
jgi:hypothetical protein